MSAPSEIATYQVPVKNPDTLTDFSAIKSSYNALCEEEESVKNELASLLEHQAMLENKMVSLHKMLPNLQILHSDSRQLTNMISFTSTLAENVSSKVRQLDLAKSNVTSCITRVEDVLDLKFCTDGVQAALQNEEYETAAGHVHRFRSLDENVIRMTADASEGSTLDSSFQLLHEAEEKLKIIVNNRFDAAVHSGDAASVERFFKIFPLLGINEEGLTKFGKYLAAKLSEKANNNLKLALYTDSDDKRANVIFADTMTLLFEEIARVVEVHQPLVETYYGLGKLFILLKILQKECDRQARKILDNFKTVRKFEFLRQKLQQSIMFTKQPQNEKLEPKELDVFLSELVILNARTEMYQRFFRRRAIPDVDIFPDEDSKTSHINAVDTLLNNCDLRRDMQELIGHFITMEEFYMREMVSKAVSMEIVEEGSHTSSMVDDTFYIVKKSIRRCISSGSVDGICAMLNHACTILEHDFQEVLYSKLRSGFPSGFDFTQAYNLVQSSIQKGKLQTSDTEKARSTFLMALNNAEVSCDYIKTLKISIEDDVVKIGNQINEQSKAKIETCLNNLGTVSARFKDVLDYGFSQLNDSAVKPRIKPLVEVFLSTSHNISEEDFTMFEANDPWVQNFIVNLDNMLGSFKMSLISSNYDRYVGLITNEITAQLEKSVLKTMFNRLGGLQFDKELRSLVGYLTSVTTWTIRDKFARLTQMATVLNLEKVDEILDYWGPNSGPLTWRLTPSEVRQVLSLRIDFKTEEIKRLKL